MRKEKAYVYPNSAKVPEERYNPYIGNLMDGLSRHLMIVNRVPTGTGLIGMLPKFFKTNWFFFSWIENLPDKKAGRIQELILRGIMFLSKLTGKKTVYILHNKISHSKSNIRAKKRIFRYMMKNSDFIITHAMDGVDYAIDQFGVPEKRIFFFPHPVSSIKKMDDTVEKKKYDLLIWGTMAPYKGVHLFLEYLAEQQLINRYRMLIAGKFSSPEYREEVMKNCGKKTTLVDRFLSESELSEAIHASRIILFTYHSDSVLSSGALMDSLFFSSHILAPSNGAFKDMNSEGLIRIYQSFDEAEKIIEQLIRQPVDEVMEKRETFIRNHTWEKFADNVSLFLGIR